MADAAAGSVYTDECRLYYNATLGGTGGTEVLIGQVIDDSFSSERRSAESNCREDAEISEHVGKPKHNIGMQMLVKRGTPGAAYQALRTAYMANTVLHFTMTTGDPALGKQMTQELEGRIKNWSESRSDNDTVKVTAEIVRDPSSSFATEWGETTAV